MRVIQSEVIKIDKNVPVVKGVKCDGCGRDIEFHPYTKEQGGSAVAFEGSTIQLTINLTGQKAILDFCESCTGELVKRVEGNTEEFKDFALDYDDYIEDEKADIVESIQNQIKQLGEIENETTE